MSKEIGGGSGGTDTGKKQQTGIKNLPSHQVYSTQYATTTTGAVRGKRQRENVQQGAVGVCVCVCVQ